MRRARRSTRRSRRRRPPPRRPRVRPPPRRTRRIARRSSSFAPPGVCRRGETVGVGDGSGRGERGRPHSPGRLREARVRRLRASRLRLDDGARLRHRGAYPRPEASLERLEQGARLRLESRAELRHDVGDERGLTLAVFQHGALHRRLRGVQARADAPRGVRRGRAFGVDGGGVRLEVLHVRRERRGNLSELCPLRCERGGRRRRGVVAAAAPAARRRRARRQFGHLRFGLVDGRAADSPNREGRPDFTAAVTASTPAVISAVPIVTALVAACAARETARASASRRACASGVGRGAARDSAKAAAPSAASTSLRARRRPALGSSAPPPAAGRSRS